MFNCAVERLNLTIAGKQTHSASYCHAQYSHFSRKWAVEEESRDEFTLEVPIGMKV